MGLFSKAKKINVENTTELTTSMVERSYKNFFYNLDELPDPDIVMSKAGKTIADWRQLETDDTISACIIQRQSGALVSVPELEKKAVDTSDIYVNFAKSILAKIKTNIINPQILSSVFYGYTVFEVIWNYVDGFWLPIDVVEKPREWFRYNNANELTFAQNNSTFTHTWSGKLPNGKFIVARHKPTYDNPYGEKTLSRVFWFYLFKKTSIKFWTVFVEKYGTPPIIGKMNASASKDEISKMLKALTNLVSDSVAIIPDTAQIEIKDFQKQNSTDAYKQHIDYCDSAIKKAILSQTLTTDVGNSGSYATSKTHAEMLSYIQSQDRLIIEEFYNELLDHCFKFNYGIESPINYKLYDPSNVDKTLAERDEILTRTGVKFSKKYFMENYNLSDEDFEIAADLAFNSTTTQFAESPSTAKINHPLDQMNFPEKVIGTAVDSMLKVILDAIDKTNDFAEAEKKILEIYPELNSADFEEILQHAIFTGDVYGRLKS